MRLVKFLKERLPYFWIGVCGLVLALISLIYFPLDSYIVRILFIVAFSGFFWEIPFILGRYS